MNLQLVVPDWIIATLLLAFLLRAITPSVVNYLNFRKSNKVTSDFLSDYEADQDADNSENAESSLTYVELSKEEKAILERSKMFSKELEDLEKIKQLEEEFFNTDGSVEIVDETL